MALEMDILSETGMEIPKAYFRIDEYSCYDTRVFAKIRGYVSRELQSKGNSPIEGTEHVVEITGDYSDYARNTKIQIYEYLKTLERYGDAKDVFEGR